jgi:protein-tyrosine phosphatase
MQNTNSADFPALQGAPNFRDLCGARTVEGREVRHGVLYRSEVLSSLTESDRVTLGGLRIGSVFDLRNPSERAATPSEWPDASHGIPVRSMAEDLMVPGADLRQFVSRVREGTLVEDEVRDLMFATYRSMPVHFSGMLRALFDTLVRQPDAATLVHCTAGKDRTGFVCAMVLSAVGAPIVEVTRDYLASRRFYSTQRLLKQLERLSGRPLAPRLANAVAELAQVKAAYLDVALGEIRRVWGSVETYLLGEAGLDADLRVLLKQRLLA